MEKLEKKKHDHKPTKWLKFLIFMFVMFAPFFSILSKCLYTLNPNVKESYYGETINEKQYVKVNYNKLQAENKYQYRNELVTGATEGQNNTLYVTEVVNIFGLPNIELTEVDTIRIRTASNNTTYIYYQKGNTQLGSNNLTTELIAFEFKLDSASFTNDIQYYNYFYIEEYNKYSYIDNVFEYAVNQLQEDNLYNWSKNTAIYNAIDSMITGLGANEVLSMLLAYWGILTAIYIVFDIVIECFTKLTHMLTE